MTGFTDQLSPVGETPPYLQALNITDLTLIKALQEFQERLQNFAQSATVDEILGKAFGVNYNQEFADSLINNLAQGNFNDTPEIKIIDSDILGNAQGAYAAQLNTIFLSDDFISNSNSQTITGVVLEEYGAFIDNKINIKDSAGDEGDIFSRLVQGKTIYSAELALLKQEDDSAFINYNGQSILIEQALPTVTLRVTDSSAGERNSGQTANPGNFRITRTGSTAKALKVYYTIGGTATKGTDYNSLVAYAVIPIGATTVNVAIKPINDSAYEGTEKVTLSLKTNTAYALGTARTGTVNILDNDKPTITILANDNSSGEIVTGQTQNPGQFTLTRTGNKASALTAYYTVGGTATKGIDYSNLSGSVTFAAGSATAKINLNIVDDAVYEGTENAIITLNSNTAYNLGTAKSATVNITDNDQPTITILANDNSAGEVVSNLTQNSGQFTLTRTGNTANALTAYYTTSGTATKGTDYTNLSGSVSFAAGSATALINIGVTDDSNFEGNENVVLNLSSNTGYNIGLNNSATVNIADNDQPTITISANDNSAGEVVSNLTQNSGQFTLTRTGNTANSLTAYYTVGGTTTNGTDYNSLTGNVTFAAGSSTAIINVNPIYDTILEDNENVTITLASNNSYNIGTANTSSITIVDNPNFPTQTSLKFDGIDDYLEIPNNPAINFATNQNFTIETWVKIEPEQIFTPGNSILEKWGPYPGEAPYPFVIRYYNGTVYAARYDKVNNPTVGSTTPLNDGQFHHIAFVKDNSILKLYIDGNLEGQTIDTTTGNTQNDLALYVGQRGGNSNQLKGQTDDLRIWNVTRTQAEIQANINRELQGNEAGLVGYWKLNGNTNDSTINANNGILINNPTWYNSSLNTIAITANDNNAGEVVSNLTQNPGQFTLTRSGNLTNSLTAYYTIGGTATNGTDYNSIANSVTFAAGSSTALINLNPIDDKAYENNESVILTLASNSNYNLGTTNIATVIIADNEFDNAGNSMSQARIIAGGSQQSFSDFIDSQDVDFYQFTPNTLSDLTITFSGLTDGAHVELLKSDGSLKGSTGLDFLYGATTNGQTASPLNTWVAGGQTYYLRVYGDSSNGTGYNLGMSLNPFYSLTVTSPNGGESLQGGLNNITWTDNISENVNIDLYKGNTFVKTLIANTASDGSETVSFPDASLESGTDYRIKISSVNNTVSDFSDNNFTLTTLPSIQVTSPNGSNSLQRGQAYTINWNDNIADNVRLDLYKNNIFYRNITTSTPSNGSFTWTVPNDVMLGADYKIRVAKTDGTLIDFSDNNFSITGTPNIDLKGYSFIAIIDPVGAGTTQNFYYNVQNAGVDPSGAFRVGFYLSTDTTFTTGDRFLGSETITNLAGGAFNGTYSKLLTLPVAGDSYWNGDKTYYFGMIVDDLNAVAETNEINNSGQKIQDDYTAVKVNATSDLKKFLFAYNVKSGEYSITDSYYGYVIADANKYTVGQIYDVSASSNESGFNGSYYIASIEEYDDSLIGDAGKVFVSSYTDRDNGTVTNFVPYKYKNGLQPSGTSYLGSEYDYIEDNQSANSQFGGDYYEADPNNVLSYITVTNPDGGNGIRRGQNYTIQWNDNIAENVRIDLYKAGVFYRNITDSTPSTGSFVWSVPTDVVPNDNSGVPNYVSLGSDYTIRVRSTTNTSLYDVSNANFSIIGNLSYDLLGSSFSLGTTSLSPGSAVNTSFSIRNDGSDATGTFKVGFYLSTDTNFASSDDYFLGNYTISSLNAKTTTSILSSSLTLPSQGSSFWSGDKTYYIGAIADYQNAIAKTNESNNSNQLLGADYQSISVTGTTSVTKYDFKFSYNNGSGDYYTGFVYATSGTHYVGKTISTGLGQYQIQTASSAGTSVDVGKVFLTTYYDADSSQASYTPNSYLQTQPSGTNSLTSESDYVYNTSSVGQGFSPFAEADVPKVNPTVDLKKYWFFYNFNPSNYMTADTYYGSVIAPAGQYSVSSTFATTFDPSNNPTETGVNGAYSVYQVDDYDDTLTADIGKVFVHNYRDRDNGSEQDFTPYKYQNGVQPSGTNYLGSEEDWIESNQSENSHFGGDYYEADPNSTTTPIPSNHWKAEYFNGKDLVGTPIVEDAGDGSQTLYLNWGLGSPSGVPSDNFSARFTTTRYLTEGLYRITTNSDDGIRVSVGNTGKRVEQWIDKGAGDTYTGYFYVGTGAVPITVEYYENGGGASVRVEITSVSPNTNPETVNEGSNWKASVFTLNGDTLPSPNFYLDANRQITTIDLGSATRSDGKKGISFDYGTRALDENSNLPHDNYAVRAYTQTYFDGGEYKFLVRGNDAFQIFARQWGGGDTYITPSSWTQAYSAAQEYTVTLAAGWYDLHFQYVELSGNANFDLSWEKVNTLPTFQSPVHVGYSVSQEYGIYNSSAGGYHAGTDIMPLTNSDVSIYSIGKGVVVYTNGSGDVADDTNGNRGFGNTVIIEHTLSDGSKIRSQYSHLKYNSIQVVVDQQLDENTIIGIMGNTGYSFGTHLHLEIERPDTWSRQGGATIMGVGYPVNHPDTYGFFDPVVFLNL